MLNKRGNHRVHWIGKVDTRIHTMPCQYDDRNFREQKVQETSIALFTNNNIIYWKI